ncbi:MAG: DUF1501 domain-containing protein, partial [Armatimonadetes bacterium]|nr:DUF1501 domain-containing protein [Armatimonadota bacterium]
MEGACKGPNSSGNFRARTRRELLARAGGGFGLTALASLLAQEGLLASEPAAAGSPLRPRPSHFPSRVRSVLFLFMSGGPSHLELFDPKPELQRMAGQKLPASFGPVQTRRGVDKNVLLPTRRTFRPCGKSGIVVSDLLPHLAGVVDELAVLRGCYGDSVTHPESVYLMNTGTTRMGRPSAGAWVSYGLGSENENLPAFVVMPDPGGQVKGGPPSWGAGFLPAAYQGTVVRGGANPIRFLRPPASVSREQQQSVLDLLRALNGMHLAEREADSALAARIAAYELAFRMQRHAPEAADLSRESRFTREAYGVDRPECGEFASRCLLARRLVERGVRFVQLYCGDTNGWDAHSDIESNHATLCARMDRPAAALIRDLRQRGLLDSTLVVWAGEFGRTPMTEGKTGRDHNPHGVTV